ncbi:MAG: replication-associated recombination protein A [Lachnospirales bacterium]
MNLFDYERDKYLKKEKPLAARMRPDTLEEFIGQDKIVAKNTLLYRLIAADKIKSLIFYGPSGTGKTTMAKIIANATKNEFIQINATNTGVKDIKLIIEEAKHLLSVSHRKTILFIDEIHRFNKSQQDVLLPYVEEEQIILIGATTENPYFEINGALISRSTIIQFESLTTDNIKEILKNVLDDDLKGLGSNNITIDEKALEYIANMSDGDVRVAINALELAVLTTEPIDNKINITRETARQCLQQRVMGYDKNGDNHYDVISAFIKSMRGSDVNAAVYYLGRMLYLGEDPTFIARRIVICASEDVGLADNNALSVALNAFNAVKVIGMPEARIILSQAVIYVASAPKSNSAYIAINKALDDVKNISIKTIPLYLKDSSYKSAEKLGHKGYKYAHDYPNHYVEQQYLPDELINKVYYNPNEIGEEIVIKNRLEKLRGKKYEL